MVRLVGFHATLLSVLTLLLSAPTPTAPARARGAAIFGESARAMRGGEATLGSAARRRPALHSDDEGELVHAISRTRTARALGIVRA